MKPGTRILVVEDDESIARAVELELAHRNFSVRCAYDGRAGLEEISEYRPELVVLDIMLPKMDGVGSLAGCARRATGCLSSCSPPAIPPSTRSTASTTT